MTGENPDDYSLWLLRRGNLRTARNALSAGISDDGLRGVFAAPGGFPRLAPWRLVEAAPGWPG